MDFYDEEVDPIPGQKRHKKTLSPEEVVSSADVFPRAEAVPDKQIKPRKTKEAPPVAPKTVSERDTRDQHEAMKQFFAACLKHNSEAIIHVGIDPGHSGAFGLLYPPCRGLTTAIDIPTLTLARGGKTKRGNPRAKTIYDEGMIWEYVQCWLPVRDRLLITIEEAAPRAEDRGTTGFAVGYGYGMWPLFLRSHKFAVETVLPAVWKRAMGLLNKDKEWSRLMAQRLWPSAPLLRKGDDGRAEALLIAEWERRRQSE